MSESTVVTVVVAIISLLGGAGFWGYMSSRKEAPIKQRDADVAVAHQSQQMAMAIAEDLRKDVDRIRGDVATERKAREALGQEVADLRETVGRQADTIASLRRAVRDFREAWANMRANWHTIRLQEFPPTEPRLDYSLKEETR